MLTLLLLLGGCDGSEFDWKDTFDPDRVVEPTTEPDTDIVTDPGAEDCIWVGTYEVINAKCGDAGFSDWNTVYDSAVLAISHNHEEGCDVVLTLSNSECTEEVTLWADPEVDATQVQFEDNSKDEMAYGVTACDPVDCKFTNGDGACAIQDHSSPMLVPVDQSVAGQLVLSFFVTYAAPTCEDGLKLTFALQE